MKGQVIQKLRAPVRLSQPGETPVDGHLCLTPEINGERRPETILELLNSPRRVIPFLRDADDSVVLLTRLNVDWVVVGSYDDGDYVRLGELKATHGNQNYEIPADARLAGMRSVVIWCDRFNVAFGTAPIERATA